MRSIKRPIIAMANAAIGRDRTQEPVVQITDSAT